MNPTRQPPEPIGPLPRLLALGIDALWLLGVSLPWLWWTSAGAGWRESLTGLCGMLALSTLLIPCWLGFGGSPGQLLLGQEVVDDRGAPRLLVRQVVLRWAVGWVSLASLLYGPLWSGERRAARAWHDRASGTTVVEQDPELHESVPSRHWAGDLPLMQSLWVNTLALPLPLLLLLGALQALAPLHTPLMRLSALLLPLGWLLLVALLTWGVVGSWRAAGRLPARRTTGVPPAWWRRLARTLLVLVATGMLAMGGVNLVGHLPQAAALLIGRDPLGTLAVNVSVDGRRLHLKGPLVLGSAARVRQALQGAPNLRWVVLDSASGRLTEAQGIAADIRSRGLPTRVSGECSAACPFVFLAGSRRQVLPGARLGLQRLSAGAFNPPYQGLLNQSLAARLASAGLSPHLVRKTLATPPTRLWYLAPDELSASGLVTVPERPLDVELPAPTGAVLADYAEALAASQLWQALEQRFAGLQALAAEHMLAAAPSGGEAVQEAGHQVMAAVLPHLLAQASPENRWLFTEILLAQMNALAEDPPTCRALLLGEPAAHRRLPRELAWREADWLLGALTEAPRAAPPRAPRPLELEVIRRTLGLRAPEYLASLWRPVNSPPPGEPDCARGRAMLSELGTLAAPQRRLALRLMFERGPAP